jgi:hypothetical protein
MTANGSRALTEILFESVDEANQVLGQEHQLRKTLDESLIGEGGRLDSMGLVIFLAIVEETLQSRLGTSVTIVDDRAMSARSSPFRSLGTLRAHLGELIGVAGD